MTLTRKPGVQQSTKVRLADGVDIELGNNLTQNEVTSVVFSGSDNGDKHTQTCQRHYVACRRPAFRIQLVARV